MSDKPNRFTIQELEGFEPAFQDEYPAEFAARCLLDGIEFLRTDTRLPDHFGIITYAHAMRLCFNCVRDMRDRALDAYVAPFVEGTLLYVKAKRAPRVPHFGEDFWDWAYALEAFIDVCGDSERKFLEREAGLFLEEVKLRSADGLRVGTDDEWFGPAIPAAAHRLLKRAAKDRLISTDGLDVCLKALQDVALERVEGGKYLGHQSQPEYVQWHLGQVAAEFPETFKDDRLFAIPTRNEINDPANRAWALSRAYQGMVALRRAAALRECFKALQKCEYQERPLGTGTVGESVKASLNTLEALWPELKSHEIDRASQMLRCLVRTVGAAGARPVASTRVDATQHERVPASVDRGAGAGTVTRARPSQPPSQQETQRSNEQRAGQRHFVLVVAVVVLLATMIGLGHWFFGEKELPACEVGKQRIETQNGSVCVSDALVEFMNCLDHARIKDASSSVKRSLSQNGKIGEGSAALNASVEATVVKEVAAAYATGTEAAAVDSCVRERSASIPSIVPPAPGPSPVRGAIVAGLVTDEKDSGLSDVEILVVGTSDHGMTDSSGSFSIALVQAGPVTLHIERAGFGSLNRDIPAPVTNLRFKLVRQNAEKSPRAQPAPRAVCYPTPTRGTARGCSVTCNMGQGNQVAKSHTVEVSSDPECARYASRQCKPGAQCSYEYVPLSGQ